MRCGRGHYAVKGFVGTEKCFKDDALFDREQVDSVKNMSDIFIELGVH